MTAKKVLENLKTLVGCEFDYDEIIVKFEDFQEGGETEVIVNRSCNAGYDYIAYVNSVDSTIFLINVDKECVEDGVIIEIVTDVNMK